MTADKLAPTVHYRDLTIEQAEQVNAVYPASSDHPAYEYEINSQGRVVDRYCTPRRQVADPVKAFGPAVQKG